MEQHPITNTIWTSTELKHKPQSFLVACHIFASQLSEVCSQTDLNCYQVSFKTNEERTREKRDREETEKLTTIEKKNSRNKTENEKQNSMTEKKKQ